MKECAKIPYKKTNQLFRRYQKSEMKSYQEFLGA